MEPTQIPLTEKKGRLGLLAGIATIVAILIFSGLYMWGGKLSRQSTEAAPKNDFAEAAAERTI